METDERQVTQIGVEDLTDILVFRQFQVYLIKKDINK